MPIGYFMDLWECHKQYEGIVKSKQEFLIDEVIPGSI